jgi:hypothetical protein
MSVWNGFHDATLLTIEVRWDAREVVVSVRTAQGPRTIVATGFTNFTCPREDSWGPSKSIMETDAPVNGTLVIHMQSGDDLTITAADFSVTP